MLDMIQRCLARRYAEGKKQFTYEDIARFCAVTYAPGDFRGGEARLRINQALEAMADQGYIRLRGKGKKQGALVYNGTFLEEMEELCSRYGFRTTNTIQEELERVLDLVPVTQGPVGVLVRDTLSSIRDGGKYDVQLFGRDFESLEDILVGADAVLQNTGETYIRDLSKKIYNDSKQFQKLRSPIEKFVRKCASADVLEEYMEKMESGLGKSILPLYNIYPSPYPILFEGNATMTVDQGTIHTMGLPYLFLSNRITGYRHIHLLADMLITIENKTTYHDFEVSGNIAKLFISGHLGNAEKLLLSSIYRDNPSVSYLHWGDIDVGGIRIFRSIQQIIPSVRPHNMDVRTLEQYSCFTTGLTDCDRKALSGMCCDDVFSDTVCYMLENNVKLEQEAIYA